MQQGCAKPLSPSVLARSSCRSQHKVHLLPLRPGSRQLSFQALNHPTSVQQLYGCGRCSRQKIRHTQIQALRSQGPGRPASPQPQPVMIDVTAEAVSTSGRDSEGDDNQQDQRNVFRRAAAAAVGLMRAVLQWMQKRFRIQKLFDRKFLLYMMYSVMAFVVMSTVRAGVNHVAVKPPQEVMYSEFLGLVNSGNVRSVGLDERGEKIYFNLQGHSSEEAAAEAAATADAEEAAIAAAVAAQPESEADAQSVASTSGAEDDAQVVLRGTAAQQPGRKFYTKAITDPGLIPLLIASGVNFTALQDGMGKSVGRIVLGGLALWGPFIPLLWFLRRTFNNKTNTKPKKKDGKSETITFADVAGVDTAKEELLEVVACLRDAQRYSRLNAKTPSGVLLCGPPGTGKTLLAKAVAGEAGVAFFAASASEFVELFVGRGAARVRELFAEARKKAPCVVFIDELDAVGSRRGIGVNEERDQTLNQLLTELDGFEGREGVLLLAATNRAEVLDPALTRPGRLSRRVVVPLPDQAGRADILGVHLRKIPMRSQADKDLCKKQIARISRGFSGAELANVVNEACLLAGREGQDYVTLAELVEAVQRTKFGVNGGRSILAPTQGLQRRLTDWMIKRMSSDKEVKSQPVGH